MLNDEIKLDLLQRGTRITTGEKAALKRRLINAWVEIALGRGFMEVELPSIEARSLYVDKAGEEIVNRQMYTFQDKGERDVCLRPEGTATCQLIAQKYRYDKDIKLFYVTRCWRYELPQEGRYREFTQFGVEVLNPSRDYSEELRAMSREMIEASGLKPDVDYVLNDGVKRGLTYYTDGMGWEAEVPSLGAQKQVLGGGPYAEGIGFALGVDRIVLAVRKQSGLD
jgi:histidyl-tRNA synthetase